MAAPEVAKTAAATAGRAVVLKVDTEAHPELAERYGVRGIPNFAVFRGGRLVFQQPGVVPSATMASWLETLGLVEPQSETRRARIRESGVPSSTPSSAGTLFRSAARRPGSAVKSQAITTRQPPGRRSASSAAR